MFNRIKLYLIMDPAIRSLIKDIRQNISQSKFDDALPLLKQLLKKDPNSIVAYLYLGFCFLKMNQLDKAETSFDRGLNLIQETNDKSLEGELTRGYLECLYQIEENQDVLKLWEEKKRIAEQNTLKLNKQNNTNEENNPNNDEDVDIESSSLNKNTNEFIQNGLGSQIAKLKYKIYEKIRDGKHLKTEDWRWWRMYTELYVSPFGMNIEQINQCFYPLEKNISLLIDGIKEIMQQWDNDSNTNVILSLKEKVFIPKFETGPRDEESISSSSSNNYSNQRMPLQRFILLENLLNYIQKQEEVNISLKAEEYIKSYEEEKIKEAYDRFMKKRKCSWTEAHMQLRNTQLVSEDEKTQEKEKFKDNLQKKLTIHNEEWDNLFKQYLEESKQSQVQVPLLFYNKYLFRLYARMCHIGTNEDAEKRKLLPQSVASIVALSYEILKKYSMSFLPMKILITIQESDQWNDELLEKLGSTPKAFINLLRHKSVSFFPHESFSQAIYSQTIMNSVLSNTTQVYEEQELEQYDNFFKEALQRYPYIISSWNDYAKFWLHYLKFKLSAQLARNGLNFIKERETMEGLTFSRMQIELKSILCQSLFESEQYSESEEICKEIIRTNKNHVQALKTLAHINRINNNNDISRKLFQRVIDLSGDSEALSEVGWIYFQEGNLQKAEELLKQSLLKNDSSYLASYRLGLIYWKMGGEYRSDKNFAYNCFVNSAKKKPMFSKNFTYIGLYFQEIEKDLNKAQKCYQKAVLLNPMENEAGENLAMIYENTNQYELALALFQEITEKNSRAHWAWKRLGYHYLNQNDLDLALKSFQFALRADSSDAMTWEGLAETYQRQGKYMAASKAYVQSYKLDDSSVYALCQIGVIDYILGSLNDACVTFQTVIERNPSFVLGYTGLAEVLFEKAKEYLASGILITSAVSAISAISILNDFLKRDQTFSKVWKLLGDISCFFFLLPEYSIEEAYERLIKKDSSVSSIFYSSTLEIQKQSKSEILSKASEAFKILNQKDPTNSDYTFDLGMSYTFQYFYSLEKESIKKYYDLSIELIQNALRMNPYRSHYWNCLGCIVEDDLIRQHCFIKSIEKNSKSSSPWNNLGALYMKYGQFAQAKKAFSNAQAISPKDSTAWFGIALINERNLLVGENNYDENLSRAKSGYIFSWAMKKTLSASIGMAYTSYLDGEFIDSCHSMMKFFQVDTTNAIASNIFSMSLYRLGNIEKACEIIEIAYKQIMKGAHQSILEKENSIEITSTSQSENLQTTIIKNYITILCHLKRFSEASELISKHSTIFHREWINFGLNKQIDLKSIKQIESNKNKIQLAIICSQQNEWKLSINILESFISSNDEIDTHKFLIIGYSKVFGVEKSEKYLNELIRKLTNPKDIAKLFIHLSYILLESGKIDKCIHYLTLAQKYDVKNHETWVLMLQCAIHPKFISGNQLVEKVNFIEQLCNQGWELNLGNMLKKCDNNSTLAYVSYILIGYGYLIVGANKNHSLISKRIRRASWNASQIKPSSIESRLLQAAASVTNVTEVESIVDIFLQSGDLPKITQEYLICIKCHSYILSNNLDTCKSYVDDNSDKLNNLKPLLLNYKAIAQYLNGEDEYIFTLSDAISKNQNISDALISVSLLLLDERLESVLEILDILRNNCDKIYGSNSIEELTVLSIQSYIHLVLINQKKGKEKKNEIDKVEEIKNSMLKISSLNEIANLLLGVSKYIDGGQSKDTQLFSLARNYLANAKMQNSDLYYSYYYDFMLNAEAYTNNQNSSEYFQNANSFFMESFKYFQDKNILNALNSLDQALQQYKNHSASLALLNVIEKWYKTHLLRTNAAIPQIQKKLESLKNDKRSF